jgi:S1-C subfamily serine protease
LPELEAAWKELLGGATTGAGRSSMLAVLKIIELGLHITFVTPEQAAAIGAAGAVVVRVDPGPAQNAGVRVGDVIAAINGRTISSRDDLLRVGRTIGPGASRYSIRRDDKMLAVDIECPGCVAAGK